MQQNWNSAEPPVAQPFETLTNWMPVRPSSLTRLSALPAAAEPPSDPVGTDQLALDPEAEGEQIFTFTATEGFVPPPIEELVVTTTD